MSSSAGPKPYSLGNITDVGVVMFGETLKLRYANDQARNYMERAGNGNAVLSHRQDLRLEIIKLGTQIRERDAGESCFHSDESEARKTVRTKQGAFHLRALRVLDRSQRADRQIMILIEDRMGARPPLKSPKIRLIRAE